MFGGSVCKGFSLVIVLLIIGLIGGATGYWLNASMNYSSGDATMIALIFSVVIFVLIALFDSALKSGEFRNMIRMIQSIGKSKNKKKK
ncbi:MAG: hypothetical protein CVV64_12320 [Candidatus Wallbacteria bacterium HGW-Wallbacteria-1]|jgi:hypothetical protein|uniref:Uncharacterized protein n=1 Tax=Candidatus Wallbacteria bacterium HGW-Wallbacteria-1 TaxID=2013854 RepID=A0A2N1PN88_9BACT|nr:MAG: hypothetical protein CVV64_12320 [Candidatus Wallbacteria bacterium HGW-Wallbacteria-1]